MDLCWKHSQQYRDAFSTALQFLQHHQSLFCSSPPASGLGVHKNWGWDTAGTPDPNQRDIPPHMGSCSACKPEGRRKVGTFGMMVFVFPNNCYKWWGPAPISTAEHLPAHGKQWINSLCCFACVSFCFPYESLSQLTSFLTFTLLIFSPITVVGERVNSCRGLGCQLGLKCKSLFGTIHGAQSIWDNDRSDWHVLDCIYSCYFCSTNNQAPVIVMGLTCLTVY